MRPPDVGTLELEGIFLGGRETNGCHWSYEIAWPRPVGQLVRAGVQRRGEAMQACRVVPFDEGGGMRGGHMTYLWTHGDVFHVISVHGYRNPARARAMIAALAETVRMVRKE